MGLVTLQFKQRWYAKDVIIWIMCQKVNGKKRKVMRQSRRVSKFSVQEDSDPLSVVVNLFDVAMVFAVALMVAMVMHMNMTEVFTQEDFTVVKNPGKDNMEIIMKEGNKINKYTPSQEQSSGSKGKRVGVAMNWRTGRLLCSGIAGCGQLFQRLL